MPELYRDRPDVRVLQLASMNAMWERAFADARDDYDRPRVEAATEGCGADAAD